MYECDDEYSKNHDGFICLTANLNFKEINKVKDANGKELGLYLCLTCGLSELDRKFGPNHEFMVPEEYYICVKFKREAFYLMEKHNAQFNDKIKNPYKPLGD